MEIIKETKYLIFKIKSEKLKTKVISVINKVSGDELATIEWYPYWRQYTFQPDYGCVWNQTCLAEVISCINLLMSERPVSKKTKANIGQ
jgi:hypothetical protein